MSKERQLHIEIGKVATLNSKLTLSYLKNIYFWQKDV